METVVRACEIKRAGDFKRVVEAVCSSLGFTSVYYCAINKALLVCQRKEHFLAIAVVFFECIHDPHMNRGCNHR